MTQNLKQKVTFYDPHPGFGGAIIPLPRPLKVIAEKLNGQNITLEEALGLIELAANKLAVHKEVSIVEDYKYISFRYGDGRAIHSFRLIRYR